MSDLISRKAAIDALDGEITITGKTNAEAVREYVKAVKCRIERIPPIQPKRGRWIDDGPYKDFSLHTWLCSECGDEVIEIGTPCYNFCPSCGAEMSEGSNDD